MGGVRTEAEVGVGSTKRCFYVNGLTDHINCSLSPEMGYASHRESPWRGNQAIYRPPDIGLLVDVP
jgi:hypothetical protein